MVLSANDRESVKIMEQFDSGSVVQRAVTAMERLDYGPEVELELVIEKENTMDDYYDDYYGGYEDEEPNPYHGTYSEE